MERTNTFLAQEQELRIYNGQAIIDLPFQFVYDDAYSTAFEFRGYVSAFMYVYDERSGQLIKRYTTQVTRNSNYLVLNCSVSDTTFEDNGKYYYEIGFVMSGGYSITLRYGTLTVI